MMEWNQEIINQVISEFRENIENAINYILMLEKNPKDIESIHTLFRNFHTIKGNASVLGFEKIIRLSHEAETLLSNIRDQTIEINSQITDVLLMSTDALTALVDEVEGGASFDEHKLSALINTISSFLPPESLPKKARGDQLSPDDQLASCLQIIAGASQILDQLVSLAMSGRFNSALTDIHEKTAKLSEFIEDALYPKASNLLSLFQDYVTVIRIYNLLFSEHNFGLLKNLFLTFTNNLTEDVAGLLGIRLVTKADLCRHERPIPGHESLDKDAGISTCYAIIDLSGNEDLDKDAIVHLENTVQKLCETNYDMAIIDPFKQGINDLDIPSFASSLEALHHG
jgi:HPt (histidine-containing phosphotransfer) domain-containing protein